MANILVIDDDAGLRQFVRDTLEPLGHTVTEAADGATGMQRFTEAQFDLVITDIVMPEQEGLETIEQMLRLRPAQRVIAMSGGGPNKTVEFLRLAQHIGARRFLKKPFGSSILREAITACLE